MNMGIWQVMKTTLEVPDALFRRVKSRAAERGQSLKQFVTAALQEKLADRSTRAGASSPPWMRGFGRLRAIRGETAKIQRAIDDEFDVIEPEDRR